MRRHKVASSSPKICSPSIPFLNLDIIRNAKHNRASPPPTIPIYEICCERSLVSAPQSVEVTFLVVSSSFTVQVDSAQVAIWALSATLVQMQGMSVMAQVDLGTSETRQSS
jgi:hypothetical protein